MHPFRVLDTPTNHYTTLYSTIRTQAVLDTVHVTVFDQSYVVSAGAMACFASRVQHRLIRTYTALYTPIQHYTLLYSTICPYLNNRVFLSRNYGLIVAPQKFDVLKTIFAVKRSFKGKYASLRTSNFQGATFRPIVLRHKHSIFCIVYH